MNDATTGDGSDRHAADRVAVDAVDGDTHDQDTATGDTSSPPQAVPRAAGRVTAADSDRDDPRDDGRDTAEAPDDADDAAWPGLRPLEADDLAALDPAVLESDLDEDEGHMPDAPAPAGPQPIREPQGPASSMTADDLTSETVLRAPTKPPRSGWRRVIFRATGGAVAPGASRGQRERNEQLQVMRTPVTHPRRITVLSRKGGVGKTTTTLMLGQTLANERGDRIIAVDGNPDAGNLGYRIDPRREHPSITDLLNDADDVHRYADVRRYTTQTTVGLEVLRSDDDPHISTALGDQEYGAILSLLDRFYNLILIDTGTGILDSAVQGILDGTDQIVLVVSPSLDAARSASQTLDWLSEHGFVELVENAVAVINQTRRSTLVDVARIEDHFFDRCGATVRIPWDSFLEAGAETELDDVRPATRDAYRHLATAVARRFDT